VTRKGPLRTFTSLKRAGAECSGPPLFCRADRLRRDRGDAYLARIRWRKIAIGRGFAGHEPDTAMARYRGGD